MKALILRDFRLIMRNSGDVLNLLIFYFLICFIISFSMPEEAKTSLPLGYSIIILSIILTATLSQEWVFERDLRLGVLQQIYLNSNNYTIILAKILSSFLLFCVPLSIISPFSTLFFGIEEKYLPYIFAGVICTSLIIAIMNTLFSAITIGIRNGGIISLILSIPLYISLIVINIAFANAIEQSAITALINLIMNLGSLFLIIAPLTLFLGNISLSIALEDF